MALPDRNTTISTVNGQNNVLVDYIGNVSTWCDNIADDLPGLVATLEALADSLLADNIPSGSYAVGGANYDAVSILRYPLAPVPVAIDTDGAAVALAQAVLPAFEALQVDSGVIEALTTLANSEPALVGEPNPYTS